MFLSDAIAFLFQPAFNGHIDQGLADDKGPTTGVLDSKEFVARKITMRTMTTQSKPDESDGYINKALDLSIDDSKFMEIKKCSFAGR